MKDKHLAIRIEQCLALAKASNCPRRQLVRCWWTQNATWSSWTATTAVLVARPSVRR